MDLTNLSILLFLAIAAIGYFSLIAANRKFMLRSTALLLGILLLTYSNNSSALAALGARDNSITQQQQQFDEELKLTPDGGHYSGIEYAQRTAPAELAVSDQTIKESIESHTGNNVIVAVANGSVRLSGTVKDKETAKHIVEEIKEIPGVHEITFNLGLNNISS